MRAPRTSFYSLAWRWHFYAGLFVAPFMILLALTGIVYLFKPQLDPLMYRSLLVVQAEPHRQDAAQLLAAVHQAYPKAHVAQYLPPPAADRSAQFVVHDAGRELNVFVDPYRAAVLGEQDGKRNLQAIARALHSELMIGTLGDRLIEMAAGWGIVLVVSGLYLWWPRGRRGGVLWLRKAATGRLWWRDLHAVSGFWGAGLLLVMLLSGMTWTGFWGKQYAELWNRFPAAMWTDVPQSTRQAGELNQAHRQTVPWAVENTPMPQSGAHAEHAGHHMMSSGPAAPQVSLQQVEDIATAKRVAPGYSITLPTSAEGVFTVAVFADDPRNDATLHVDQYDGRVLADVGWRDYNTAARATELGVKLHEGMMFGTANQIIVLLVCLMILLGSVSGLVMWWKRRPSRGLGVPPLRHDLPRWKVAVAVMLVLGVVFPLVGVSMLVLWAVDSLVVRRQRTVGA
ncbi:PepSY domain-containing protein [Pseudomonas sp.]|uniref:PepSY-associated TM helix domain-containing protein n=1 Tax=Pseudomonas sp. TaxID=306 RepID=UPI0028AB77EE|nr:PepSY domain-containing protein [Pseudomonas sp.]